MTGYNHYPDCTCGWCVNYGRSRVDRAELHASYRRHEAESFLKKNDARSIAGCYVNPNARCPVCRAAVFFYANEFGSRVYFDDLGPPWPKHPCTDNPRQEIDERLVFHGPPARRARGITQELIEAARIAGAFRNPIAEDGRWQLLIIVSVDRHGPKNTVQAELLASDDNERVAFTCHSDEALFEVGDFISKRGDEYSFLHKDTLATVALKEGEWVHPNSAEEPPAPASRSGGLPTISKSPAQTASHVVARPTRTYDMTREEMAHFHSKKKSVKELCDELLPVVRAYARNGIRKPRHVAERLNKDGYRTLLGVRWTPRLTYFLLGLIFMPNQKATDGRMPKGGARKTGVSLTPNLTAPMTAEEMAQRLSRLGRVVLPDDGL